MNVQIPFAVTLTGPKKIGAEKNRGWCIKNSQKRKYPRSFRMK